MQRCARARPPVLDPADIRGVYLWAGNATIDLQSVKFPDIPIDRDAHLHAHTGAAAAELAAMGVNLVFLSMNWGFPPEQEVRHWADFETALANHRAAGHAVVAYVQASNCLAEGSYRDRDWYARTPRNRVIPYFRRRWMTCWNHPDWLAEVEAHATRAVRLGAAAVFFDNIWMGATPWTLGGAVGGFAGCHCKRCRNTFLYETGLEMPRSLGVDERSARYLGWRADLVARTLEAWANAVRDIDPRARVYANISDSALRDTAALFGIDVARAGRVLDGLLIENIALPRLADGGGTIIGNALPVRAVRAQVPDRPVLTVTYEQGIGLDGPPPPRQVRRGIAEHIALGAAPVLKASEYLDSAGRFTVLTCDEFVDLRAHIGRYLRWAADHAPVFAGGAPDPHVHVLLDPAALVERHADAATRTFAVAGVLLARAVPFAFLTPDALASGAANGRPVLVPFGTEPPTDPAGARIIRVTGDPPVRAGTRWLRNPLVRRLADPVLSALATAYFGAAPVRRLIDRSGLTRRFLLSPFFRTPADPGPVLAALRDLGPPPLAADTAVLAERVMMPDGRRLIHLVNYDDRPALVHLSAPSAAWRLSSPDPATRWARPGETLEVDVWAVLEADASRNGSVTTS